MNQVQNESSSTNTILIVLVLAAIVAFGVWFFSTQGVVPATTEEPGLNVDVNLPAPTTNTAPTGETPAPTGE